MKYLLDTNIIIGHLRGQEIIDIKLIKAGVGISIITYAELIYGAQKSQKPQKNTQLVNSFINDLYIKIIEINKSIAQIYGSLKAVLEKEGQKLDEFDLLIAATALACNIDLVTLNHKHFKRISGLSLYPTKNQS